MFRLDQQTAIITGAASGIGRAVADLFARQGASLLLLDLNKEALENTAAEITATGASVQAHVLDVTDQESVRALFAKTGRADILVNSAGISHIGKAATTEAADFERVFRVNVQGIYNCLYAALPLMQAQKKGVILNMASIANNVGLQDRFAYSMSKGAVLGMTLSVARDYLADGIRCNCISPARVHTAFVDNFLAKNYPGKEEEMFRKLSASQPIGRMAKPEEVAYLVLYLCSEEASFVTGCDYPFDGGFIKLNN